MGKRRSKIDIIYDMLNVIQQKGNKIKPTHLMYKANLSHKLMHRYLDELMRKEMVEEIEEDGHRYHRLTEKGFNFIYQFKKMKEFADSFGI